MGGDWLTGQPLFEGLAVLYMLCRQWSHERELLAALGVADPDRIDDALMRPSSAQATPGQRRVQVAAMGGEVG